MQVVDAKSDGPCSIVVTIEGTHQELNSPEAGNLACEYGAQRYCLTRPGLGMARGLYPVDEAGKAVLPDNKPLAKNANLTKLQPRYRRDFLVNGEP